MLGRILAKLTRQEQVWLLLKLQMGKRPAHRPRTPASADKRYAVLVCVEAALRKGRTKKEAVGMAANKWGISDRTVRRRIAAALRKEDALGAARKWMKGFVSARERGRSGTVTRRLSVL
jgi:hypothetical protein